MMDSLCALCGKTSADHRSLNHAFSTGGALIAQDPQPTKRQPPKVVLSSDPVLRALLLEKGIITGEELIRKEVELRGNLQSTPSSSHG